jgi:hypothetical protein
MSIDLRPISNTAIDGAIMQPALINAFRKSLKKIAVKNTKAVTMS